MMLWAFAAHGAPAPAVAWDWQLDENVRPPKGIAVFDTDPDNVSRAQIAALNRAGVYTICYVSVGTLEDFRDDKAKFPAGLIGNTYGDWPDERFLDIRDRQSLPQLMQRRFKRCQQMGFDAIEADNMDVFENDSGFDLSRSDGLRYIKLLAKMAHRLGLEIGQKNLPELTPHLVGVMDYAITESCYQDGWCGQMRPYLKAGKPVFDAEYNDRPIHWKRACAYAAKTGISMILKDRALSQKRHICP